MAATGAEVAKRDRSGIAGSSHDCEADALEREIAQKRHIDADFDRLPQMRQTRVSWLWSQRTSSVTRAQPAPIAAPTRGMPCAPAMLHEIVPARAPAAPSANGRTRLHVSDPSVP